MLPEFPPPPQKFEVLHDEYIFTYLDTLVAHKGEKEMKYQQIVYSLTLELIL